MAPRSTLYEQRNPNSRICLCFPHKRSAAINGQRSHYPLFWIKRNHLSNALNRPLRFLWFWALCLMGIGVFKEWVNTLINYFIFWSYGARCLRLNLWLHFRLRTRMGSIYFYIFIWMHFLLWWRRRKRDEFPLFWGSSSTSHIRALRCREYFWERFLRNKPSSLGSRLYLDLVGEVEVLLTPSRLSWHTMGNTNVSTSVRIVTCRLAGV